MSSSEEAGRAELVRQIKHFTKLGEGKPEDHEYNLTARGLQNLLADEPVGELTKVRIWTCSAVGADAIRTREYHTRSVSAAAKHCDCLNEGCEAVLLEISYTTKEIEIIDEEEVKHRIKIAK